MDQQLVAFVTVAEERNFTRAAEIMLTSQPSVSQHIQNLERKLGTKLLERTNKYVRLNKAGEIVYYHAKEILRQYDLMCRLVDELTNQAHGTLAIGASYTFGEYVLPHTLAEFCAHYPDIAPSVTIANTTEVVQQVRGGMLDIGVIEGSHENDDDVSVESFAEDNVVIVASANHPFIRSRMISPQALEKERWVVRETGSGTREVTDRVFRELGISPASILEFGSTQAIKEAVQAGLGISILSSWAIRRELQLHTMGVISATESAITRKFSVVTRKSDFQTKATRLFYEMLVKER